MLRQPVITKDGSHTVSIPDLNVTYHSLHGAIQESKHVFIDAGFNYIFPNFRDKDICIFEMGFGTGLNALLTFAEAEKPGLTIHYTAVELFPLQSVEINELNYCEQIGRPDLASTFEQLHKCEWEKEIGISPFFRLQKIRTNLVDYSGNGNFDVIYYDAFAPRAQPELWTKEIFEKMVSILKPGGILVTYCSKSIVRRAMLAAGFMVEKIPGPHGKREMVRAKKTSLKSYEFV